MHKNLTDYSTGERYSELEWLETNGLGGWASASVSGCNTRRYHGLLVAATNPPTERLALVSKLDECIIIGDKRIELGTNDYGDIVHPTGFTHIQKFSKTFFPEWLYESDGIQMKKTIAMVHGENTTLIIYEILKSPSSFTMELLPLISARGYHALKNRHNNIWWDAQFSDGIFRTQPNEQAPVVYMSIPGASYTHRPDWFHKFNYAVDKYRGQEFEEDLFNHGIFNVELKEGDSLGIIVSTQDPAERSAHQLLTTERKRRQLLLENAPEDETTRKLILAADQFIVQRKIYNSQGNVEPGATVIAGYHWFTDWGRDTMISLPGLCICTGRFDDAKRILAAFASSVSQGMLPNRFRDYGEEPEYNNVDGTLWFFIAVYKYLQASGDREFVLQHILPVLGNIIDWHQKGTRYQIKETGDGLLYSAEDGVQLTWMDAKVGDWVVTPRKGKAVEVNALWYNALCIFAKLLHLKNEHAQAGKFEERAQITKESFSTRFWNEQKQCLFDVVDDEVRDERIRPNQLFAISLPFPLLDGDKANAVISVVSEKLYTPVGLRSLPSDDHDYVGVYGGDVWHRDASYHQGTVWSWLLGPYIDAIIKTNSLQGLKEARKIINDFKYHLYEGAIGSISEIFDGDAPHHSRGCIAQAWSVAEVLRVITEYKLTGHQDLAGQSEAGTLADVEIASLA